MQSAEFCLINDMDYIADYWIIAGFYIDFYLDKLSKIKYDWLQKLS